MRLCAVLTKHDLASAIEQVTPLRVNLRPRRVIWLGRPTRVELVAGAGLRIRGDARFTWDVGGLTIPVSLRSWQVMLVPSLVARGGGHVLAFDPILEALDFKSVPMFLDGKIKAAINDGLAAQKNRLAWDFEKTLSIVRPLPDKVSPGGQMSLGPVAGNVRVTAEDMRLELEFELRVERAPESVRQSASDVSSQCTRVNVAPKKMIWDER